MKNPRISAKERGLIKGSLRRVFGRSDLRRKIIDNAIVKGYKDIKRKAVKFWVKCTECGKMEAKSNVQVDHKIPLIPLDSSLEEMSWDDVVNRLWCEEENLKIMCKPCHKAKSKLEAKQRAAFKKGKRK